MDGDSSGIHNSNNISKNNNSVRLFIKSSNPAYTDLHLIGQLSWSVRHLKKALYKFHPTKPPIDEQKLIYSGKLLQDNVQLKDVLRSYTGVNLDYQIIHLVHTPKSGVQNKLPLPRIVLTARRIRRRHNVRINEQQLLQQQSLLFQPQQQQQATQYQVEINENMTNENIAQNSVNSPQNYLNNLYNNILPFGMSAPRNFAEHQTIMCNWIHQVYSQYTMCVYQYFRMNPQLSSGNVAFFIPTSNEELPGIAATNAAMMMQAAGNMDNTVMRFTNGDTTVTTQVIRPADRIEQEEQRPAGVMPRFPHIVEEDDDGRDWFDSFYSLTRFVLFLTIIYFNSSPFRCFFAILIGSFVYLYHNGLFGLNRERRNYNRNNRQIGRAANMVRRVIQQNNANVRDGPMAILPAQQNAAEVREESTANSVCSFMRTFILTFFTSLLPEVPFI